jgi:hypothetical protein
VSVDPKQLAEIAKRWGFIDLSMTPKNRQMSAPDGSLVNIKRDTKEARQEDVDACAAAVDITVDKFLSGPDKKRVQATEPRRQVIAFLASQPDRRVHDKSGGATRIIAEALGGQQTAVAQLLKHMVRDGQLKADRTTKRTYSYELDLDGPRVLEMMPLETIPAKNAHLPMREEPPPSTNGVEPHEPVPVVDLANYHPDDIANALLERLLMMLADGSPSVHAKVVAGLEERLAEQVEYAQAEQRKRRRAEDDLARTKAELDRARNEVLDLKRARATIPADVVDQILVGGQPRVGANRRPPAKEQSK